MNEPRKLPPVAPVTFTPFQGLMKCAEKLVRVAELRTGVSLWDGVDGMGSVTEEILRGWGVPEKAISLGGDGQAISPRRVAEVCGVVKRPRKKKVLR